MPVKKKQKVETVEMIEMEKAKSGSFVTMPEIITFKALRMQGFPDTKIAEKTGRSNHTIAKALKLFDQILPEEPDLKNKVSDRLEEITERYFQNAEMICHAADKQVMAKIFLTETTAMDAAKIRQIYGNILARALGMKEDDPSDEKNPRIVNFINTVINIQNKQKDDRLGTTTSVAEPVGGNVGGRKEVVLEGVKF